MKRKINSHWYYKPTFAFMVIGALQLPNTMTLQAQENSAKTIAKEATIKGLVLNAYNQPIPGATIAVLGTNTSVVSDNDGNFSIRTVIGSKLRISFLTMIPSEIEVTTDKYIKVKLEPYDINIGEVVVTGYAQTTTRRTTGSVAVVDGEKLKDQPLFTVDKYYKVK